MRHDAGVQQRLPRSSHPRDHRRLAAEAARHGGNGLSADAPPGLPVLHPRPNARWRPVGPARGSTGPVARHDLRQNSFLDPPARSRSGS
jgi:hypothetical protein